MVPHARSLSMSRPFTARCRTSAGRSATVPDEAVAPELSRAVRRSGSSPGWEPKAQVDRDADSTSRVLQPVAPAREECCSVDRGSRSDGRRAWLAQARRGAARRAPPAAACGRCHSLGLAAALRLAPEGPPPVPLPSASGLHGDVDGASATLQAAWPTDSDVPDVLAPGLRCVFCGINPGRVVGRGGRALREPAQRLLAAAPRRRLHAAALRPRSSSTCSSSASASRTRRVPHHARLGRPPPRRLRRPRGSSGSRASCGRRAIAFVGKEAYRGAFGERPGARAAERHLVRHGLFVLPSTSPANAAVPYAERLRWFTAFRELLDRANDVS